MKEDAMTHQAERLSTTIPDRTAPLVATRRRGGWSRYSARTFYLFLSPWLLGLLALQVFPLAYAMGVSFTNFVPGFHWHWVGLSNYNQLIQDPQVWASLRQTLLYALITVSLGVVGGLGLALLLHRPMRGIGLFRSLFYLPAVVPIVAAAVSWKLIFDRDTGLLNGLIHLVGGPSVQWLADPYAFTALIVMVLWSVGSGMIIFLAGLQGISAEVLEAASVDGAGAWRGFWSVRLPLLTPVLLFQVIVSMIYALQTLIQPLLLSQSGSLSGSVGTGGVTVPSTTTLYMVYVYQEIFTGGDTYGYGSALLWVLFAVILVITFIVFRSSKLWVYSENG